MSCSVRPSRASINPFFRPVRLGLGHEATTQSVIARTLACLVETRLDTLTRRRHEWRRGTQECVRHAGDAGYGRITDSAVSERAYSGRPAFLRKLGNRG